MNAWLSPRGLRSAALEATWFGVHLALYPLGLAEGALTAVTPLRRLGLEGLPPSARGLAARDLEAAGTPIVLVHGLFDNRSIFSLLQRGLRRRGFGHVHSVNYSPRTPDLRAAARDLADHVEALCTATGYDQVHLVGHSLGGLVGRYYVQCLGGHARVHTLITLGTPHAGTRVARAVPQWLSGLGRQLLPGSDVVTELAAPAPGVATRFVAYWSDLDELVSPKESGRLEHPDLRARSVLLPGVGHMSLPIDPRAVHGVCTDLAHLAPDDGPALQQPSMAACGT